MAYPQSRSCNAELIEGATDGGVWKSKPNRGGQVSSPSNQGQANFEGHPSALVGVLGPKGTWC